MGRPKFRITVDNLMHAARYIDGRLGSQAVVPRSMSIHDGRIFINQILLSPKSLETAEQLQTWCEANLEGESLLALQVAVRKRRQRTRSDDFRVLTVSNKAYELLSKLAKRDQVTLSTALEKATQSSLRSTSSR